MLQIRKFQNKGCCQPYRCNIQAVISQPGFLPGPVVMTRGENGLGVGDPNDIVTGKRVAANAMHGICRWRLDLNDLIESNVKLTPVPFDFCCVSTRGSLGQRYCKSKWQNHTHPDILTVLHRAYKYYPNREISFTTTIYKHFSI